MKCKYIQLPCTYSMAILSIIWDAQLHGDNIGLHIKQTSIAIIDCQMILHVTVGFAVSYN